MRWKRIMQWLFPNPTSSSETARFDAAINEAVLSGEKAGAAAGEVVAAGRVHKQEIHAVQAHMQRVAEVEGNRRRGQTSGVRDLAEAMLLSQLPPEKRKG